MSAQANLVDLLRNSNVSPEFCCRNSVRKILPGNGPGSLGPGFGVKIPEGDHPVFISDRRCLTYIDTEGMPA